MSAAEFRCVRPSQVFDRESLILIIARIAAHHGQVFFWGSDEGLEACFVILLTERYCDWAGVQSPTSLSQTVRARNLIAGKCPMPRGKRICPGGEHAAIDVAEELGDDLGIDAAGQLPVGKRVPAGVDAKLGQLELLLELAEAAVEGVPGPSVAFAYIAQQE